MSGGEDFMLVVCVSQKEKSLWNRQENGEKRNLVADKKWKQGFDCTYGLSALNAESFEGWLALYLLPSLNTDHQY
jgi:hypothetical protein